MIYPKVYFLIIVIIKNKPEDLFSLQKNTDNVNSKITKTKNDRLQLKFQWSICENKKSRFVKEQEAKGILSSLGIKTPLSKIPGLNNLF